MTNHSRTLYRCCPSGARNEVERRAVKKKKTNKCNPYAAAKPTHSPPRAGQPPVTKISDPRGKAWVACRVNRGCAFFLLASTVQAVPFIAYLRGKVSVTQVLLAPWDGGRACQRHVLWTHTHTHTHTHGPFCVNAINDNKRKAVCGSFRCASANWKGSTWRYTLCIICALNGVV